MQTIVSPQVLSKDEHAIVALLSGKSAGQAISVQNQLADIFGGAIWLQQPPSLHVTLMEIICNSDYTNLTRRQHFERWFKKYNQTVKDVLAEFPAFDITFNELLVSQRAIIIKTADSKPFNDLRETLLSRINLPEGTKTPPGITHCTLARFNKVMDLHDAVRMTDGIGVDIAEHVDKFSLVKDLGPPSFNGTPMQTYRLARLD